MDYDVLVIGAGVVGTAIARELSKYKLRTCVIEKEEDVCSETSKANSGIVHAGYDADPGTLKAKLNVLGAAMIRELSEELDFPFKENGSMVIAINDNEGGAPDPEASAIRMDKLQELLERGKKNGVKGLKIISGDEAREIEPALSDAVEAALLVPTGGIVCPFLMTVAFAENAAENGVEFRFLEKVKSVIKDYEDGDNWKVITDKGIYTSAAVINAAGVHSGEIHNQVSSDKIKILPRRGEYVLMDHDAAGLVEHTIFQLPTKNGKGVLVTPTVHGNLMVGPNATLLDDMEDTETTAEGIEEIKSKALLSVPGIPYNKTITSFAGIRATEEKKDFVIQETESGFFDAAGIESPGLSSAPAIGEMVAEMVVEKLGAVKKEEYKSTRKGFIKTVDMTDEEKAELIKEKPEYGRIVCRCENVTEGEIMDCINRPVGARSLDGVKRRVRQGMGRCQAGFCTPRTIEILARELGIPEEQVCKNRPGSELIYE